MMDRDEIGSGIGTVPETATASAGSDAVSRWRARRDIFLFSDLDWVMTSSCT